MPVTSSTEDKKGHLKPISALHPVLMEMKEAVVLDIETTGFSPEKFAEIIEIGAVKLDVVNRHVLGTVRQYIHPSNTFSIPAKITELTRIGWAHVADQPFIEDVLPKFANFIGDTPIVAHNALFDWPRFLVPAFRSVGLHATNEAICSMHLAKELFPGRGRSGYNLAALCEMYGHPIVGHHDALQDSMHTASLFVYMLKEYRNKHANDTESLFEQTASLNPLPSSIGTVDFDKLQVYRVSPNKGMSPKHGPRIYVSTNFGRLCYSVRRHLWTVLDLWSEYNAPAQLWGTHVLQKMGLDADSFIQRYSLAS